MATMRQCSEYLKCLFQSNFINKIKNINQFYNGIYKSLWDYYSGVIPNQYVGVVPITEIREIDLKINISDRGVLNAIVYLPTVNYTIEIGISVTDNIRNTLKSMFGSELCFGKFRTKEAATLDEVSTEDNLRTKINDSWDKWVVNPLTYIDQAYTNPDVDKSNSRYFRDIYCTAVTTNISIFSIMVHYNINVINKNAAIDRQIYKYSINCNSEGSSIILRFMNKYGDLNIYTELNIPVGIQCYANVIKQNLINYFERIFIFYNNSDPVIPDYVLKEAGNKIFPLANLQVKEFEKVEYYCKESINTTLGEVLNAAKKQVEEKKQTKSLPKVKEQVVKHKEDLHYTKSVTSLLTGRIADPQVITSKLGLLHHCYLLIRTLFEVSTDIEFVYNVRVYKRLVRDKFHTLSITVFHADGILVNFSVKVLLEFDDMPKRKGMVVFISGNSNICDQRNSVSIVEESNVEIFGDTIYNTVISHPWFRSIPSLSIQTRNNDFKKILIESNFNKDLIKFISKNSAHRFTMWPVIELNGIHIFVDVYLRIDLIQTYLITLSDNGQFVYSAN